MKNVVCDVHTSHTKLGKPLGATGIVRGSAKGRRKGKGKGKGKMRGSGVQATEVEDMQLCIDSKTNSGVDDSSSPVDVDGVDNVNKDSLTMLDSEGLLSAEEQKLLHYVFDDSKNEMDIVVSMNLHGRACEVGTRRDMRTLKQGSWLSDIAINLGNDLFGSLSRRYDESERGIADLEEDLKDLYFFEEEDTSSVQVGWWDPS
ncbi:uncharacterized protein LOC114271070 [Camellia sinensis]|uniref:uncharacterized protein LOC114271070 n=1 Tax=Camellia sinensis TaxID=4442 RepID=UPI001035C5B7|nr:uncharacterized protein LOC114271070 [Camellia sinensis]